MTLAPVTYREVRLWRAAEDGHFFLFLCFERLPEGGFVCPYAAKFRNWNYMSQHMEDWQLRHNLFEEMSKPNATVYKTPEEAANSFDLNGAVES